MCILWGKPRRQRAVMQCHRGAACCVLSPEVCPGLRAVLLGSCGVMVPGCSLFRGCCCGMWAVPAQLHLPSPAISANVS